MTTHAPAPSSSQRSLLRAVSSRLSLARRRHVALRDDRRARPQPGPLPSATTLSAGVHPSNTSISMFL